MLRTAKSLAAIATLTLVLQLSGCTAPTGDDVTGVWVNPDGGRLSVKADGTFTAENLPRRYFFDRRNRTDPPVSGAGTWNLQEMSGQWRVTLAFRPMSGYPTGFAAQALVHGSGEATQLFGWNEGDEIQYYKLRKAR
ncbi:MAG TPA: hypothetical protein VJS12_02125 [Steroidobacteraceae bacterium]|nr:hypothetical protein [Steroidobacteraceae bacterium]